MAINLLGLPRATEDLDIFVAPEPDNIERLKKAVPSIYSSARKVGLQRAAETARTALGPGSLPKGRLLVLALFTGGDVYAIPVCPIVRCALLFIHPPAHGSEVGPAALKYSGFCADSKGV